MDHRDIAGKNCTVLEYIVIYSDEQWLMHSKKKKKKKKKSNIVWESPTIYLYTCILLPVSISLYLYTWWRYNTAKTNLAVKK